jgi:hypothetical protein
LAGGWAGWLAATRDGLADLLARRLASIRCSAGLLTCCLARLHCLAGSRVCCLGGLLACWRACCGRSAGRQPCRLAGLLALTGMLASGPTLPSDRLLLCYT